MGINGCAIEDAADFDEFLKEVTPHWDYVDEDLMKRMQNAESNIKVFLPKNAQGYEQLAAVRGIAKSFEGKGCGRMAVELEDVQDEDWAGAWKKYFKPIEVGEKFLIKPSWEPCPKTDRYVLEMLRNGALGYILKDVEPTMLIKAIHVVANGGTFVYPKLAERIFGGLSDGADVKAKAREMWRDGRGDRLTAREMDVLACIAKGFSNQDIAKALFVSENVNDRTQALIYVLKHKIVSLE